MGDWELPILLFLQGFFIIILNEVKDLTPRAQTCDIFR